MTHSTDPDSGSIVFPQKPRLSSLFQSIFTCHSLSPVFLPKAIFDDNLYSDKRSCELPPRVDPTEGQNRSTFPVSPPWVYWMPPRRSRLSLKPTRWQVVIRAKYPRFAGH